eukprot:TRINITY_DN49138_c0_g1_i1.p1 TRINITY_DN49138_c0_g1~~TRINITY_DN49138_c0_g1_i1.p1  ORF type:complete len:783 (-),score=181.41 TRINITY_DN49138_c0_g1_i1:99-2357(-)
MAAVGTLSARRPGTGGQSRALGSAGTAALATPRCGAATQTCFGGGLPGSHGSFAAKTGTASASSSSTRSSARERAPGGSPEVVVRSSTRTSTGSWLSAGSANDASGSRIARNSILTAVQAVPVASGGELDAFLKQTRAKRTEQDGQSDDNSDVKSQGSAASRQSNHSTLSTLSTRGQGCQGARNAAGSRAATSTTHLKVRDCSIDIEAEARGSMGKLSLCTDFAQLAGEHGDGLVQCLQMYGWCEPNKMQQHAVPALLSMLGMQLGGSGRSVSSSPSKGKSLVVVQGPRQCGKTSTAVVSLLASIDASLRQPQAVVIAPTSKKDVEKYLNVFTLMQAVRFEVFLDDDDTADGPLTADCPRVKAAAQAQILVGTPKRLLGLFSAHLGIPADSLKVLLIDDAEELLNYSQQAEADVSPESGMWAKEQTAERAAEKEAQKKPREVDPDGIYQFADREATKKKAFATHPLLDDIVQLCNVLECQMHAQSLSDTYKIRSGHEDGDKLRFILLMEKLVDAGSKKVLRLLKNSLMKKKNLMSAESCAPPTKLVKTMKHYYAEASRTDWVKAFNGLVNSLMFPRALVFCDEGDLLSLYKEMLQMGVSVVANMPGTGVNGEAIDAAEGRRKAVQDFTGNRAQFLLSRSEPAVCQAVLPKVSCVFHFGVPKDSASIYGVRLLPLAGAVAKDSASILFLEPAGTKDPSDELRRSALEGKPLPPAAVNAISKLFEIKFMDMPSDFLPGLGSHDRGGRRKRTGVL